jgi:transcriptional regulator with XRE-family HTH domain
VDVSLVIKNRLDELGLEQRDLATAAEVTESYISQLLTRKKVPPGPNKTDIYQKISRFLKLPNNELVKLAMQQRREELSKKLTEPPSPLFKEVRELVFRKCKPEKQRHIRAIFERQPFGELERLVTQKLLDVVKGITKEELENEEWLRLMARLSNRTYEEMRVAILEFLDTDVLEISLENCVSFLDPLIDFWDINLANFGMEIVLNRTVGMEHARRFEFVEMEPESAFSEEPGLREFLDDVSLNGNATEDEIEFLKKLKFKKKQPTALYYYRELQNLRDPLHFRLPQAKNRGSA